MYRFTIYISLQEYLPNTRREVGLWSLPNGTIYYQAILNWHTSVSMTPRQVHNLGLQEVDRIKTLIRKVLTLISYIIFFLIITSSTISCKRDTPANISVKLGDEGCPILIGISRAIIVTMENSCQNNTLLNIQ